MIFQLPKHGREAYVRSWIKIRDILIPFVFLLITILYRRKAQCERQHEEVYDLISSHDPRLTGSGMPELAEL